MSKINFKKPSAEDLTRDNDIFKSMNFSGVQPSPDDDRDFLACTTKKVKKFPSQYISKRTEILDQGIYSSCVAHACASALAQGDEILCGKHNEYSRGYIYGNRRDTDTQEEGMIIRQALKQLNHCGDVLYEDFPYNKRYPRVKRLIEKDKENLAAKALPYAIKEYFRCYGEDEIKDTIMQYGSVIICVPIYNNFGRDLSMPDTTNKKTKVKGFHAMIVIGWNKEGKWIVQNSWGKNWGYDGTLLMDPDYRVYEWWGIKTANVNINDNKKEKLNWFQRLIKWFKSLFTKN